MESVAAKYPLLVSVADRLQICDGSSDTNIVSKSSISACGHLFLNLKVD